METSQLYGRLQEWAAFYGLRVLSALLIILIGLWVAALVYRGLRKGLGSRNVDETLLAFVSNLVYYVVVAFLLIAALAQLGVQTTSLIAVLGAAGLAVGLALQGSLSNLAAGLLIMMFRPFRVGHFIEGAGVSGSVEEVQIFATRLHTPDNVLVIVPNSKLIGGNITNYSAQDRRRLDLVFGVSYSDDVERVKSILKDVMERDNRILGDPAPHVALNELAESSMNFLARFWVRSEDYQDTKWGVIESVKKRFDAEGISIPFPTRQLNIYERRSEA
jgi:small conductance mechanosensitive channel